MFYFLSLLGIHVNFVSEEHKHFENQKVWLLLEGQTGIFLMANLLKLNPGYESCWSSPVLHLLGTEVTEEGAYDDGEQVAPR